MTSQPSCRFDEGGVTMALDPMDLRFEIAKREIETLNRDLLAAWKRTDELQERLDAMKGDENDAKNDQ